jgi:DNA-binding IscR family transcriptional regulator
MTRLELLNQILLTPQAIHDIGKGLPLALYIALNAGKNNSLKTSYEDLERVLGTPQSTAKQWRDLLEKNKVIEVVPGKGSMLLKLLSPYDSIATCELSDIAEIKRIGDPGLRRAMANMSSLDMVTVIASMGKLADKVGRLEQIIENKS